MDTKGETQLRLDLMSRRGALSLDERATLAAIRGGASSKSRIALAARIIDRRVNVVLEMLVDRGLIERAANGDWLATPRGQRIGLPRGDAVVARRPPRQAARRLLTALDRPANVAQLVARLGVTQQRVRQLITELHAGGLIRFGDPDNPFLIMARADDPTPLLTLAEQRTLLCVPHSYDVSVHKVRLAAGLPESIVQPALVRLAGIGLLAQSGRRPNVLYRALPAAAEHPQWSDIQRVAQPDPLPVRSERVLDVLSSIQQRPMRIAEVSRHLGIEHHSVNALFQYLKRKGLVQKRGADRNAPYVLSGHGKDVLGKLVQQHAMAA